MAKKAFAKSCKDLEDLNEELLAVIRGGSNLTRELLTDAITIAIRKRDSAKEVLDSLESQNQLFEERVIVIENNLNKILSFAVGYICTRLLRRHG